MRCSSLPWNPTSKNGNGSTESKLGRNAKNSTTWSESLTIWLSKPEPSPAKPWPRRGIINTSGAIGGSGVPQDVVYVERGDRMMDSWAVGMLIRWAGGKNADQKTKDRLYKEIFDLADSMAGPAPNPVEKLLAETAATSWFAFRIHEAQYAAGITGDGMTLAQSEHAQRRMDRAHRRFLSTVKTLSTVRRLALPNVQINVARQQVNQLNAGSST
jgi:hypothetical protein